MIERIRVVDLFCGIGGFRLGIEQVCAERGIHAEFVFASDIDPDCRKAYEANFAHRPAGDITKIPEDEISEHDILVAGFPCQPFSICGDRKGFEDTRGTLFFEIARILAKKKPRAFILENVKMLVGHDHGRTLQTILRTLNELGYMVDYRVLNAMQFGLPQKRERVYIVGFLNPTRFRWPVGVLKMKPLAEILETNVRASYFASEHIKRRRQEAFTGDSPNEPSIWHENKGGHISAYPFSCALRAGASYNYLLVNGERRLTEREMLRLQGFPESFKIVCGYQATRKQAGNAVAVPCVTVVFRAVLDAFSTTDDNPVFIPSSTQLGLFILRSDD